jgi:hypothetical protein
MEKIFRLAGACLLLSTVHCIALVPEPRITGSPEAGHLALKRVPPGVPCQLDIATHYTWLVDYCQYSSTSSSAAYTTGYTVTTTSCPQATQARTATGLSPAEASWLSNRTPKANAALVKYLDNAFEKTTNPYNVSELMKSPPRLGLAVSGGGYRAMLNGAGVMKGLQDLGVMDATLYVSGLSGGAWAVGSWALNNFPPIAALVWGFCHLSVFAAMTR